MEERVFESWNFSRERKRIERGKNEGKEEGKFARNAKGG